MNRTVIEKRSVKIVTWFVHCIHQKTMDPEYNIEQATILLQDTIAKYASKTDEEMKAISIIKVNIN